MNKLIGAVMCSAMCSAAATAGVAAQAPTAAPRVANGEMITVIGCVARDGDVEPDKGTRQLNTKPGGFALLDARVTATASGRIGSAAPTSLPSGNDTGTIPQRDTVVGRESSASPNPTGFALEGATGDLQGYIGKRVEVIGTVQQSGTSQANAQQGPRGDRAVGTSGAATPDVINTDTGTREERPAETSAHPSAELQTLKVVSMRGTTGTCQ